MEKKGQAAVEFLMTYGWAILAAIIAIGVLAYFGVFSPGKYMPDICTINAPLGCEENSLSTAGVRLIIRNGAGDSIDVSSVNVTNCDADATGWTVADGSTLDVTVACVLPTGKFSGDIIIAYKKTGAQIEQTATGRISGSVTS